MLNTIYHLPTQQRMKFGELQMNVYFGERLAKGENSVVVTRDLNDRIRFMSTCVPNASRWNFAGQSVSMVHSSSQCATPATVIAVVDGEKFKDIVNHDRIAKMLKNVGVDLNKRYPVSVFK